jgi:hypothetical protein
MTDEILRVMGMRVIRVLVCIGVVGTLILASASEEVSEHSWQAIAFFIGFSMLAWGIETTVRQDFVCRVYVFGKKLVVKKTGKIAKIAGLIISIVGTLLAVWGMCFWVPFIGNILRI